MRYSGFMTMIIALICSALLFHDMVIAGDEVDSNTDAPHFDLPEIIPFSSLRPPYLMEQNPDIKVSSEGNYIYKGLPRYLVGNLYYEGLDWEVPIHNIGYPESLNWIYDSVPNYQQTQQLGFDSVGTFTTQTWITKYRPKFYGNPKEELYCKWLEVGLPLYVDYTNSPWHHGHLNAKSDSLPKEAFAPGGSFWPYSIVNPVGRGMWLDMWRSGAEYIIQKNSTKPFVYELFNEPAYKDDSDAIHEEFARRMEKKYVSVKLMNNRLKTDFTNWSEVASPGQGKSTVSYRIEYARFREDLFNEILDDGVKAIRDVDRNPDARFCFQPLFLRNYGINMFTANTRMTQISSSTGGGNLVQAHVLRALADGKPISDGEMYTGKTRKSFRNAFVREFMRGFNASYLFKWSKRASDWRTIYLLQKDSNGNVIRDKWGNGLKIQDVNNDGTPKVDENGTPEWRVDYDKTIAKAKRCADSFGYHVLNPFSVPPKALSGIMDAKLDITDLSDLFARRDRGNPADVAFLYSTTTDNYAMASGNATNTQFDDSITSLEYAHVPLDVIFEEQLSQGRQNKYKVIIAAGIISCYPKTPSYLSEYVNNGGIVIFSQEAMQLDEYGLARANNDFPGITQIGDDIQAEAPSFLEWKNGKYTATIAKNISLDNTWRGVAMISGTPALYTKKIGKGALFFLNAKMPISARGQFLKDFVADIAQIMPCASVVDPDTGKEVENLEVYTAKHDGMSGYLLHSNALGSVVARLDNLNPDLQYILISHENRTAPYTILKQKNNGIIVKLASQDVVMLLGASAEVVKNKFGDNIPVVEYAKAFADAKEWRISNQLQPEESSTYNVDKNRIFPLDIRTQVNSNISAISSTGKAKNNSSNNEILGMPWGVQNCRGIPMEFIRPDQNFSKTCLILQSITTPNLPKSVAGISVDRKVRNMYFLHAVGGSQIDGTEAFAYIVQYMDRTTERISVRSGIEVGNWMKLLSNTNSMLAYPGWLSRDGNGFWILQWRNPNPDKTISSISIESSCGKEMPIIAAISAEEANGSEYTTIPLISAKGKAPKLSGDDQIASLLSMNNVSINLPGDNSNKQVKIELPVKYSVPEIYKDAALVVSVSSVSGKIPFNTTRIGINNAPNPLWSGGYAQRSTIKSNIQFVLPLQVLMQDNIHQEISTININASSKETVAFSVDSVELRLFPVFSYANIDAGHISVSSWDNSQVHASIVDGFIRLQHTEKAGSWCGCSIHFTPAIPFTIKDFPALSSLFGFDISTAPDLWGKHNPMVGMQASFSCSAIDGKNIWIPYRSVFTYGQKSMELNKWMTGGIFLKGAKQNLWDDVHSLKGISIQFQQVGSIKSGVQLKQFMFIKELPQ